MNRDELKEKLALLPEQPGVYLFRDTDGEIIYIGKARSLKNRVRSYFHAPKNLTAKVLAMVNQIADVEHIITDNEVEALILEANLVREHQPKYNIRLRDDKNYPYLRVDLQEEWPRLQFVRSARSDGAHYFGPFTRAEAVRETMRVLRRVFPYRTCTNHRLRQGGPPCLYYHIGRCPAPCDGLIEREEYLARMQEMVEFLEGKRQSLLERLQERMEQAAANLEFETAAELRDQIAALQSVLEKQKIADNRDVEHDVVGLARSNGHACMQVFFVREGNIIGREHFMLQQTEDESDEAIMTAFLKQFYRNVLHIPPALLLNVPPLDDEKPLLEQWFTEKSGRRKKVRIQVPKRGKKKQLVDMVAKNAAMQLEYELLRRQRYGAREGIEDLQRRLGLSSAPKRIECYDISNLQGTNSVAAMVVFVDGKPHKAHYRKFRIESVVGPNDYASMQEVLYRRFRRYKASTENEDGDVNKDAATRAIDRDQSFASLPDLIIVDGGKGQLAAAREVLRHYRLEDIPTYGLAERNEWLYHENQSEPIVLPQHSAALYLLQRIRDETHRFALGYHQQSRRKASIHSLLDEVPGIGAKRKRELLRCFGSVEGIRQAGINELAAVPGMNKKIAAELYEFLKGVE